MLELDVGTLLIEGTPVEEWEVMLKVNASFRLRFGGGTIIDEPSFPVIELAKKLMTWDLDGPFEYRSQESDATVLLLVPSNGGFYVASPMSGTCAESVVDGGSLVSLLNSFVSRMCVELSRRGLGSFLER